VQHHVIIKIQLKVQLQYVSIIDNVTEMYTYQFSVWNAIQKELIEFPIKYIVLNTNFLV